MTKCMIINNECPKTSDPAAKKYCPAWTDGVVWRNSSTGEEKIVNCSFRALMPAMVEVVKASNRPAAAVESVRNEVAQGFAGVATAMENTQRLRR